MKIFKKVHFLKKKPAAAPAHRLKKALKKQKKGSGIRPAGSPGRPDRPAGRISGPGWNIVKI